MRSFMFTVLIFALLCAFTIVLSKPTEPLDLAKEAEKNKPEEEEAPLEDVTCPNTFFGRTECITTCVKQGGSPTCCTYTGTVTHCKCLRVSAHYLFSPAKFFSSLKQQMSCDTTSLKNYAKSLFSSGDGVKAAEAEGDKEGTAEAKGEKEAPAAA